MNTRPKVITERRLDFHLPASLLDALTDLAERNDRPVSREARRAIVEYLDRAEVTVND